MNDDNEVNTLVNRHMARLLTDLEDAKCPRVYHGIVKGALVWLRSDICEAQGVPDNAPDTTDDSLYNR
jgi:hypothetical protein